MRYVCVCRYQHENRKKRCTPQMLILIFRHFPMIHNDNAKLTLNIETIRYHSISVPCLNWILCFRTNRERNLFYVTVDFKLWRTRFTELSQSNANMRTILDYRKIPDIQFEIGRTTEWMFWHR